MSRPLVMFGPAPPEPTEDDPTRYPGSKQVRRAVSGVSADPWDSYPHIEMLHNGETKRFYTVGILAKALGKSSQTIRKWENWGYIPRSQYRFPGRSSSTHHRKEGQRRLYTREQIEGVVSVAYETGVLTTEGKANNVGSSGFPEKVTALFEELKRAS